MIRSLLRKSRPSPRVPDGHRVYAIGDVHGRADCLDRLLDLISSDHARRGEAIFSLVLLGDLIDRGPDSRRVVDRVIELARIWPNFSLLTGNHEELLLRAAEGQRAALALFDKAGGRETMLSYGISAATYDEAHLSDIARMIVDTVPPEHMTLLSTERDMVVAGDYVFVHAGIRPRVPLAEQKSSDLRWIREPFLSDRTWHGAMVVHGHTITDEPVVRSNRIGIDTGAFATGRLTAIGLEGAERWFLSTS